MLINCTQHDQTKFQEQWNQLGIQFSDSAFTPWGETPPNCNITQVSRSAWNRVQTEWDRARCAGFAPAGLLVGGWVPIVIPVVSFTLAQSLPPLVIVAIQGPQQTISGDRRSFSFDGWRVIPPVSVLKGEGLPLAKTPNMNWKNMVHCSSRPLEEDRKMILEGVTTMKLITPEPPALPPAPGTDLALYDVACRRFIEAAIEARGGILFDGPAIETAIRIALLARSHNIRCFFVRTGLPPAPKKPGPIVGIEEMPVF